MSDPYYQDELVTLHHGDCLDVLRELPDSSVDSVVCDPPYGLANTTSSQVIETLTAWLAGDREYLPGGSGFMGKAWDAFVPPVAVWDEALRVLKPGGHLLAFAGSRTFDLMALGVRLAGFEVRDSIAWLYGSGFPKSLDVGKAIDKLDATDERRRRNLAFTEWMRSTGVTSRQVDEATSSFMGGHYLTAREQAAVPTADMFDLIRPLLSVEVPEWVEALVRERTVESENYKRREVIGTRTTGLGAGRGAVAYIGDSENRDVTAAHTEDAARWQGWGTALKPAFEPIVVGRKPLAGTVAANVLAHGTGALNIDACRVETDEDRRRNARGGDNGLNGEGTFRIRERRAEDQPETSGRWPTNVVLDESQAAELDEQTGVLTSGKMRPTHTTAARAVFGQNAEGGFTTMETYGDSGGASRFFPTFRYEAKAPTAERPRAGETAHPTVKPLDLMRWLVRLVTPPGGTVLEPFAGSGTTAEACVIEGFHCIAVEREADYLPLITQRLTKPIAIALDFGGVA